MRTIAAAEFKAKCLALLDDVDPDGIIITKRGKPVARLVPIGVPDRTHLIGSMRGQIIIDDNDDLFSTGAWISDEWGDLDAQPGHAPADFYGRRSPATD